MIYNLINYLNFFVTFVLLYFLSVFLLSIYGFSWLPDTVTRLNLNDALFNLYHFLWVTALYLSPFYFLVWAVFLLFSLKRNALHYFCILTVCYYFYCVEVLDFIVFNWQSSLVNTSLLQFNTLLVNNLNKIHPFLFYSGTFLVFNTFLLNSFFKPVFTSFYTTHKLKQTFNFLPTALLTSLVALFLGSWWAVQEGTWGGWWNWDPSETFGLLFFLFILSNIHTTFSFEDSHKLFKKIKLMVYVLVLSYFFIQLNFDLVSHNFGVKFFYFFNNKLFFYLIIVLTSVYLIWSILKSSISNHSNHLFAVRVVRTNLTLNWFRNWTILSIQVLITVSLLVSFFILFNYFIWNFVNFNLFNFDLDRSVLNIIFFVFLSYWVFLFDFTTILPLFLFSFFFNNYFYLLWYLTFNWTSFIFRLHQLIIFILFFNLLSLNNSFILWSFYTFSEDLLLGKNLLDTNLSTFTCDCVFVDKNIIYKTSFSEWFTSWNFFLYSNTPVTNTFSLNFSNASLLNFYTLFNFSSTVFILIENNYIVPLASLVTLVLIFYWLKLFNLTLGYYY